MNEFEKTLELGKEIQKKDQEIEELKNKLKKKEAVKLMKTHQKELQKVGNKRHHKNKFLNWFLKLVEKHGLPKILITWLIYCIVGFVVFKIALGFINLI